MNRTCRVRTADHLDLCGRIFRGKVVDGFDEQDLEYEERFQEMVTDQPDLPNEAFARHIIHNRRDVVQHAKAFDYLIYALVIEQEPLTKDLIKRAHSILCKGVPITHSNGTETPYEHYTGIDRTIPVAAGNTMFTMSQVIPRAMRRLIQYYDDDLKRIAEKQEIDLFALAAKYCLDFVQVHPFQDGNRRMCRTIMNALLCRYAGIVVLIGEHEEDRIEYLNIKKRASAEMEGHGELPTFVLEKVLTRLRVTKQNLAGERS